MKDNSECAAPRSLVFTCNVMTLRKARAMVDEKIDQGKVKDRLDQEKFQQQQAQNKKDEREKKRKKIASTLSFGNDCDDPHARSFFLL